MNSKVLADLQDLIMTLHRKSDKLKDDEEFRSMWLKKGDRLQNSIRLLTPQEHKELEGAFSEWMRQNFPDAQSTQVLPIFQAKNP